MFCCHSALLFLLFLLEFTVLAQQFIDPRTGAEFFKNRNYSESIKEYEKLVRQEQSNPEYFHRLGISYLKTNINKSLAVQPLEKATKLSNPDNEVFFDLAYAYQLSYRFDEAIKTYKKYKSLVKDKPLIEKTDKQIESCITAKELMKTPLGVEFVNLGSEINSEFSDYYPFVAKDESFIVFTSRRRGGTGGMIEFDGLFPSDIYIAEGINANFGKAKNIGPLINTSDDEQAVGLSDDAKTLYVYIDHIKEFGDIYSSEKKNKAFQKTEKLGAHINSTTLETSASISSDGNTIFFAANRPDGYGGLDLYMVRKLPNGEWAITQNLGAKINSKYNEDFPTLSADGQTLYFSSEGHASMGGYDVFKAIWNEEENKWSAPINIGYPLNTPDEERVISFNEDGTHAYISALRKGGFGDLDIYKVIFKESDKVQLILQLKITIFDSKKKKRIDANVQVDDSKGEMYGSYQPNPNTEIYTIILPLGVFSLTIEAPDHKPYKEKIIVTEEECKKGVANREINLKN